MATRSQDNLELPADGIEGSKLPSGKQILGYFLYQHAIRKEIVHLAATLTIQRVEKFWYRAQIPVKHQQNSIRMLEQLPSGKQILGYFLYQHTIRKEIVHLAATLTIQRVEKFWCRAQIPVKHQQNSIRMLEQLLGEWQGLKKNKSCRTPTQKHNETTFSAKV